MDSPINNLSLCSGGAGLDLGVELVLGEAFRTVCWVEWEAFAADFLATRMEAGCLRPAPLWTDVRTFDGRPWRGLVDSVTAGYPCQPFSCAGKRRGSDDPRHLWPHVRRIVGEVEPSFVFLENVSGHLSLGAEEVFGELEDLGYRLAAGLFTASEVGATHKRERLFILGAKELVDPGRLRMHGRPSVSDQGPTRPSTRYCRLERDSQNFVADAFDAQGRRQGAWSGALWGTLVAGASGSDGATLADGSGQRFSQRTCDPEHDGQEQSAALRDSGATGACPLFPPGPNDFDAWAAILAEWPGRSPAIESGVCGVVDGLAADRAKWLKLLGNGVVPLQAAHAFRSLWAALRLGE